MNGFRYQKQSQREGHIERETHTHRDTHTEMQETEK